MDDELRRRARELFEEVNGFPSTPPTDPYLETTLDHVFGRIWSRPGLTRKERRWITLTAIASQGADLALDVHLRSALESGDITGDEMIEFALHFAHYAGWPASAQLYTSTRRLLGEMAQRDADTEPR